MLEFFCHELVFAVVTGRSIPVGFVRGTRIACATIGVGDNFLGSRGRPVTESLCEHPFGRDARATPVRARAYLGAVDISKFAFHARGGRDPKTISYERLRRRVSSRKHEPPGL